PRAARGGARAESDLSIASPKTIAPASAFTSSTSTPAASGGWTAATFKTAASLATAFGRVRDLDELRRILGRAADAMDASGLMVWMGSTTGGDLRPVLAHGYA